MSERAHSRSLMLLSLMVALATALPASWASPGGPGPDGGALPRAVTDNPTDLIVPSGEKYELYGCHTYTHSVQINGTLTVRPYDGTDPTTGALTLQAPWIIIGAGGTIVADGRGFGGGGGGSEYYTSGGKGGTGGKGGEGDRAAYEGGGGGGGSNGGAGGLGGKYGGSAGTPGTELKGGNGGDNAWGDKWGGTGGTGFGGGGGGGSGDSDYQDAGGGGGGGSGGAGMAGRAGGAGAGTAKGAGGQYTSYPQKGGNGGYAASGSNGDTSTDLSVLKGSGGGGGSSTDWDYYGGGGGGGAGGGSVALISSGDIVITGTVSATGAGGGKGGSDYMGPAGEGGGGAGGGVLLFGINVTVSGSIDNRGRNLDSLSNTNGGTFKLFYASDMTGSGQIQAGRIYKNGRPVVQTLKTPENGSTALLRPDFEWAGAMDPEGDSVTYHIQVSTGPDFTPPLAQEKQGFSETAFTSEKDLVGTSFFWRVRARDALGFGPWSSVWNFFTDLTPPQTQVAALPKYTAKANFTVSWSGTDDSSGISRYDIFVAEGNGTLDFSTWQENTLKKSAIFNGVDGRTYNFYSIGTDAAYNTEEAPGVPDATTTVDISPPVTTMASLVPYLGVTDFTVSWSGKDATSGVQYYNVFVASGESDFELWLEQTPKTSQLFEGEGGQKYSFYAIGCDIAGNWEAAPTSPTKMARTMVDLTPPTASVRFGNPNFGQDPVFVSATTQMFIDGADDMSGVNGTFFNIDERGTTAYSGQVREGSPGSHNMSYWCADKAQNKGQPSTVWFFVDIDPPVVAFSFNGPGWQSGEKLFVTANTTLVLSAFDTGSGVNYIEQNIDKRSYTRYSSPIKFSSGTHSVVVRSSDKVGNVGAERSLTVVVDGTPPVTSADSDLPISSNEDVSVTLTPKDSESGVAGTFFRILREKVKTGDFLPGTSATFEASKGDGNYTLQYYSVDNVNNTEKVKEIKLRIDTTAMLEFIEGPRSVDSATYLLQGRTEPGAGITIGNVDVKPAADGTFALEVKLKPGKNTITVNMVDLAGNTAQKQVTITYNEPISSADWFLPLIVVVVVAASVGAGAFLIMRRGRTPPPQPYARTPPARGPAPPAARRPSNPPVHEVNRPNKGQQMAPPGRGPPPPKKPMTP